jgi:hypothetical protein
VVSAKCEVTGHEKDGRKVFHLLVEAPNEIVANLYATAQLQRTPNDADAVRNAIKTEARLGDRLVAIREELKLR